MGKLIIILAIVLSPLIAAAQSTRVIYGHTYTLNDLPVSGISIKAKKAKSTAVSDSLGNFMIVCNEKDQLSFNASVFRSTTHRIKANTPDSITVRMDFAPTEKNVELAIGYGYISEKNRTQAIQHLHSSSKYSNYQSIFELLRNNFPNLSVSDNGCIIIRGPSSLNGSNCALLIVDNVKTDNIDHITPSEVQDISIIKDGSAAIYGVEGGNGVVIITLRRGEYRDF